jgi:hypothetical protein
LEALHRAGSGWQVGIDGADSRSVKAGFNPVEEEYGVEEKRSDEKKIMNTW